MKTIEDLCKSHRTRTYYIDPDNGLIGVVTHTKAGASKPRILWYYQNPITTLFTLSGETTHTGYAEEHTLPDPPDLNNHECPACHSPDIERDSVDIGDNCAIQDCRCFACGHGWIAHYSFIGNDS